MKSQIITKEKVNVDINDEVMGFVFTLGKVFCALIGAWAAACVVAGLISFGPLQMIRGYITAITGF
ncbi:hypothetical protein [Desulforhopalus sp. 52FAK]